MKLWIRLISVKMIVQVSLLLLKNVRLVKKDENIYCLEADNLNDFFQVLQGL